MRAQGSPERGKAQQSSNPQDALGTFGAPLQLGPTMSDHWKGARIPAGNMGSYAKHSCATQLPGASFLKKLLQNQKPPPPAPGLGDF